jgi:hypothetical protein
MRGKIGESTLAVVMHRAQTFDSVQVTYGDIVDTQGYDDGLIILNVGNAHATATIGARLYENANKNIDGMALVTGAKFPLINATNRNQIHLGNIKCKDYKRFLALRLDIGGVAGAATIGASATAILAKGDVGPSDNTLAFDLG